jgi:hypothetical protein
MTRRYAIGSFAFFAMLGLAGCGGGPPTGDVSGTASFEGVPIAEGSITFHPLDGKGSVVGDKIVDGRYAVKKAPVGPCRVQITSSKEVGKKKMYNTPNSPEMPVKIDPLPKKYNDPLESELRFDVQEGSQEKNWDLR